MLASPVDVQHSPRPRAAGTPRRPLPFTGPRLASTPHSAGSGERRPWLRIVVSAQVTRPSTRPAMGEICPARSSKLAGATYAGCSGAPRLSNIKIGVPADPAANVTLSSSPAEASSLDAPRLNGPLPITPWVDVDVLDAGVLCPTDHSPSPAPTLAVHAPDGPSSYAEREVSIHSICRTLHIAGRIHLWHRYEKIHAARQSALLHIDSDIRTLQVSFSTPFHSPTMLPTSFSHSCTAAGGEGSRTPDEPLEDRLDAPRAGVRHTLVLQNIPLHIRAPPGLRLQVARPQRGRSRRLDRALEVRALRRAHPAYERVERIHERARRRPRARVRVQLLQRGRERRGPQRGGQRVRVGVVRLQALRERGEEDPAGARLKTRGNRGVWAL